MPGRIGVNLFGYSSTYTAILAEHEDMVGRRNQGRNWRFDHLLKMRSLVGDDLLVHSDDDATSQEFVAKGGGACIFVTADVAPKAMQAIVKLAKQGRQS